MLLFLFLLPKGIARLSEIPVKDVVIVVFMLTLWAYSIALIVRAWAKVNLNVGTYGGWVGDSCSACELRTELPM